MGALNTRFRLWNGLWALLPVVLSVVAAEVARADDSDPSDRVARLGYVDGQVSIEPAGVDEWAAADLNRPLTSGDKLWADADSRVELSIGSAVVRLASGTGFSFLNLDDRTAQMQLTAGTANVHVRTLDENETLEIDTPNSVVSLLGPGDYRVEVNDAGDATIVKVAGGTANVSAGGQEYPVNPQQRMTLTGTNEVAASVGYLGAPDAFDSWGLERDRRSQTAQTSNYVSPDVIGAEDLDQNGTWQSTPEDGYVWAPNVVAAGWAPYHDGHWVWVAPWGWTWVDAAPWGFAPFHYGRWATYGGRWCWVPGPRQLRPVYAPALVAWVGGAPVGASAAFGGRGGVAWFPLGPREVYMPAYPVSRAYVTNINVTNTTVNNTYITNVYNHNVRDVHYVNRNAPGAITAVSQTTFTNAQPVGRNAVRLSRNELAAATSSATAPPITPARQSLYGPGVLGPSVRRPPPAIQNRQVVARTPPPPAPAPFAAQQRAISANGGRPIARSELKTLGTAVTATQVRVTVPAANAARPGFNRAAPSGLVTPAPRQGFDRPQTQAPVGHAIEPRAPDRPPTAAPAIHPPEFRPAFNPPATAPAVAPQPAVRLPGTPQAISQQRDTPPPGRSDRPSGSFGQPIIEDRPRTYSAPRPAEQDSIRHFDRPAVQAAPAPVRAPAPPPLPAPVHAAPPPAPPPPPPVQARPAPAPAAKPAPHPEKSTRNQQ